MTLQQAKDQVAKKYGYNTWSGMMSYMPYSELPMTKEAYELYCLEERRRTWDEACGAMRDVCVKRAGDNYGARTLAYMQMSPKPEFKP
jgi:hypothetical protein